MGSKNKENNDCRAISESLLKAFSDEEGVFYGFNCFVKEKENKNKLVVCFRGNESPNQITIYYNNHEVWKLYLEGKDEIPKVEVSFNHARYYADWDKLLDGFKELGFNICDKRGKKLSPHSQGKGIAIGTIVAAYSEQSHFFNKEKFVKPCYENIMKMMDTFFDIAYDSTKVIDYFRTEYNGKEYYLSNKYPKRAYIEKRWQQALFNELKFTHDGLFVYDLEFSQPRGVLEGDSSDGDVKTNEPDMLAIRYKGSKPVALVLIEVKSTYDACANGNSKLVKHFDGMNEYCKNSKLLDNRKTEAYRILQQYKTAGLYVTADQDITEEIIKGLPVEMAFIFTSNEPIDCIAELKKRKDFREIDYSKSAIYYLVTHIDVPENHNRPVKVDLLNADVPFKLYAKGNFELTKRTEKYAKYIKEYQFPSEWN